MKQSSQNTYGTLAEDLRCSEVQEWSPHNQIWWQKKKKRKPDRACDPGRKLWKRKGSLTLGSPFTGREISWDRKGASEAWRRRQQQVSSRQNRERLAQRICATLLLFPAQEACLRVRAGAGCWNLGFREQTWGENCGWLHEDSLKGLECGTATTGCVCTRSLGLP